MIHTGRWQRDLYTAAGYFRGSLEVICLLQFVGNQNLHPTRTGNRKINTLFILFIFWLVWMDLIYICRTGSTHTKQERQRHDNERTIFISIGSHCYHMVSSCSDYDNQSSLLLLSE
jgi:hypothetical protein